MPLYTTLDERQALIAEAEARGETMLHDNHYEDGTKELIFGVIPDGPPLPPPPPLPPDPILERLDLIEGRLDKLEGR